MMVQAVALSFVAFITILRFRYNRKNTEKDIRWILILWLGLWVVGLTPWSQRRWVLSIKDFLCWTLHYAYLKYQEWESETVARNDEFEEQEKSCQHGDHRSKFTDNESWNPMKPMIFPCRTSHTRLFPKIHSFSYSYLFVGIPVGWRGHVSNILSADLKNFSRGWRQTNKGWLNVESADYLARGENSLGLRGKLDDHLKSLVRYTNSISLAYLQISTGRKN